MFLIPLRPSGRTLRAWKEVLDMTFRKEAHVVKGGRRRGESCGGGAGRKMIDRSKTKLLTVTR